MHMGWCVHMGGMCLDSGGWLLASWLIHVQVAPAVLKGLERLKGLDC